MSLVGPMGPDTVLDRSKSSTAAPNAGGFIFAENPYGDISKYQQSQYGYDLGLLSNPQRLMGQNYDLQRQKALGTVGAGVTSGTKTGATSLASTTGLGYADKQALAAQGQRQRVNLSQGATSPYDQMQSQNMYDTEKFNADQSQSVLDYNAQMLNQRARDIATENEKKAVNLYQQRMREALLERQLDAARAIAQKQGV